MKTQRILSMVLSTVMLMSAIFNASSAAADETNDCSSWKGGKHINCTFEETTGTLTVSGKGQMENFDDSYDDDTGYYCDIPWVSFQKKIKTVIIENGVTSVGDYSFEKCVNLTSVTIPDTVSRIGCDAFRGCSKLKTVVLPDGVKNIENYAFLDCIKLSKIEIPSTVISVGTNSFRNTSWYKQKSDGIVYAGSTVYKCKGKCPSEITVADGTQSITELAFENRKTLKKITIPDSVNSIGKNTFTGCQNISKIKIDKGNQFYDSRNNCNAIIYTKSNMLIFGCKNTVIPNGVKAIGNSAFEKCTGLRKIIIPDSVTKIYNDVFAFCKNLRKVTLPRKMKLLGEGAFRGCKSLKDISLPKGLTDISMAAFQDCKSLKKVTIPNSVKNIEDMAFYDCSNLKELKIGKGVNYINDYAFGGCTNLEKITVAKNNHFLDSRKNCNAVIETSHDKIILGCKNTVVPNSVRHIGNRAFWFCEDLKQFKVPDKLESIGMSAFENCTSLKKLVLPNGFKSIELSAFDGCKNLQTIVIPKTAVSVGNAFQSCKSLKHIYYAGSKKQWKRINYDEDYNFVRNTELSKKVHYNYEYTKIKLDKTKAVLNVNQSFKIKVTVKNKIGKTAFQSNNTKIAKVTLNGVVTALKKGKAKIIISNNGVKKSFTVIVR